MRFIPADSIDLVLTDPPYNIGIDTWDKINNYQEIFLQWVWECERVIRKGGQIILFHNDMSQFSQIIANIVKHTSLFLYQFVTVDKPSYADKIYSNFNTYVGSAEYFVIFGNVDIKDTYDKEQVDYFQKIKKYIGKTKTEIKSIVPFADHCFRVSNNKNYSIPSRDTYNNLIQFFSIDKMDGFVAYDQLRLQRPTFNSDGENNVLKYAFVADKKLKHKTQKPLRLICDLVNIHSNKSDTVLDFTIGSGTTAIACIETGRNYIGFEISEKYCDIANERVDKAKEQYKLFANV